MAVLQAHGWWYNACSNYYTVIVVLGFTPVLGKFRVRRRTRNKGVNDLHIVCPMSCQQSDSLNWGIKDRNFQKQPAYLGAEAPLSHMTWAFRSLHPTDFMGTEPVQMQRQKWFCSWFLFLICNHFKDDGEAKAEKDSEVEKPQLCALCGGNCLLASVGMSAELTGWAKL